MRHYQQKLMQKAKVIGPCGGSNTMKIVSTKCDKVYKASPLDGDNRVLATLAFIEALDGNDGVVDIISALSSALDAQG